MPKAYHFATGRLSRDQRRRQRSLHFRWLAQRLR